MKGLFLDDERNPQDVTWMPHSDYHDVEWTVVRNFQEFKQQILEEWDVISFDHDLQDFSNGREYTGYDCLKILPDNYGKYDDCPMIEFHTMNPIGRERMRGYLASWAMCHM